MNAPVDTLPRLEEESDGDSDVSLLEDDEEAIYQAFFSNWELQHGSNEFDGELEEANSDFSDEEDEPLEELSKDERLRLLVANFNEDQMNRYENYRRTGISRPGVKKLANAVLNQSITQNVALVLSGLSKVFVGEIIEKAREVQEREHKGRLIEEIKRYKQEKKRGTLVEPSLEKYINRENEPLTPDNIREAWRLYRLENATVPAAQWRRQGEADGSMFR